MYTVAYDKLGKPIVSSTLAKKSLIAFGGSTSEYFSRWKGSHSSLSDSFTWETKTIHIMLASKLHCLLSLLIIQNNSNIIRYHSSYDKLLNWNPHDAGGREQRSPGKYYPR